MQASSQLYLGNDTSELRRIKGDLKVDVLANTTFQCARESAEPGLRTAVLNFANPREPGGGVLRGAMNQEECLCRCSDLYNALAQPYFMKHYYQHHVRHCDDFFPDRLIDSPDVTVIKSDDAMPQVLSEPFYVDVRPVLLRTSISRCCERTRNCCRSMNHESGTSWKLPWPMMWTSWFLAHSDAVHFIINPRSWQKLLPIC